MNGLESWVKWISYSVVAIGKKLTFTIVVSWTVHGHPWSLDEIAITRTGPYTQTHINHSRLCCSSPHLLWEQPEALSAQIKLLNKWTRKTENEKEYHSGWNNSNCWLRSNTSHGAKVLSSLWSSKNKIELSAMWDRNKVCVCVCVCVCACVRLCACVLNVLLLRQIRKIVFTLVWF